VALGIAFRNKPVEHIGVDVVNGPFAAAIAEALTKDEKFTVTTVSEESGRLRLRTGRTDLVVVPNSPPPDLVDKLMPRPGLIEPAANLGIATDLIEYLSVPTRPESRIAWKEVDDALQRAAGRKDRFVPAHQEVDEPGGRYIDFLVPGLLAMGLMGGGLWGVGFAIVDMRLRKLLKRFLATPMKKTDFLGAIMISLTRVHDPGSAPLAPCSRGLRSASRLRAVSYPSLC